MKGISKSFHGVYANRDVNLSVKSGEIVGLLGENGAGKTTLMNILYGLYKPDSGDIEINGKKVRIKSPVDSTEKGIGMVHQHFMLVQNHSVIENIALGYKNTPFLFPQKKLLSNIKKISDQFKFSIDTSKMVWQLSAGEQQRVEILKALINGADLLILDEPTSVLTPDEAKDLFRILREMKQAGHMVILISHKLDEIMDICDRVVVLRKGSTSGKADTKGMDKKSLARMMIGRDVIFNIEKESLERGDKVLSVKNITVDGDKGYPVVNELSFEIFRNEIFGIAGISGNGQRELVEAITGLRPVKTGQIDMEGKNLAGCSPKTIFDHGIAHVPEERIKFGIAPGLSVYDNAVLKQHHLPGYSGKVFMEYGQIKRQAKKLVDDFNVHTPSINIPTKNLSGGNIQKLILGREISENPALLVASHPTYGLDVGATEYLRNQLLKHRKNGGAVLLVSEDLEEIFELCDRVAVIFKGKFAGVLGSDDERLCEIGMMMAGSLQIDDQD